MVVLNAENSYVWFQAFLDQNFSGKETDELSQSTIVPELSA